MTYLFGKIRSYFPLAAALAAAFAFFGALLPASARASAREVAPTSTFPADQAVLARPPSQVFLTFPGSIRENGTTLQVFDQEGRQVDLGKVEENLDDPSHTVLMVKLPALPQGAYLVKWNVTFWGGDSSSGAYYFGVGRVTLPADPTAPAAPAAAPNGLVTPWSLAGMALVATAAAIVLSWARQVLK